MRKKDHKVVDFCLFLKDINLTKMNLDNNNGGEVWAKE